MSVARSETGRLLDGLLEEPSAVAFIQRCLRKIARANGLTDAILVLEDETAGRQAFRVGRRPIDDAWSRQVVFEAPAGLQTRPFSAVSAVHSDALSVIARLAWRIGTLKHQARVDPLTGLLNRHGLQERLEEAIERRRRHGERFTLVMGDVDRFKAVNDRLGHPAGDRLLQLVGDVLGRIVRGVDVAARTGGDEFTLLLADAGRDAAAKIEQRLTRDLPQQYGGIPLTVSVGAATCPDDGTTISHLHDIADRRLYENKRRR